MLDSGACLVLQVVLKMIVTIEWILIMLIKSFENVFEYNLHWLLKVAKVNEVLLQEHATYRIQALF